MALLIFFVGLEWALFTGVVFAGLTVWIALRKGYQPIPAATAGAIIGPIALLIYLFLPRTLDATLDAEMEQRILREQSDASKTRLCPNCHRVLSITARVCPKCETRF